VSTLLVLGAGGHGRVVCDAALRAARWSSVSATDRDPARCSGEILPGVRLAPPGPALATAAAVHLAIGNAEARQAESKAVGAHRLATVVHPDASVSPFAALAAGCFVGARAVVAPGASLGVAVIVNHGAVVDHDVAVGDFSHIAPGATLGGGASIGCRVLVGAGASVLPGISVCDDATIGAGAVVDADVVEPGVHAGVPARRIR